MKKSKKPAPKRKKASAKAKKKSAKKATSKKDAPIKKKTAKKSAPISKKKSAKKTAPAAKSKSAKKTTPVKSKKKVIAKKPIKKPVAKKPAPKVKREPRPQLSIPFEAVEIEIVELPTAEAIDMENEADIEIHDEALLDGLTNEDIQEEADGFLKGTDEDMVDGQ